MKRPNKTKLFKPISLGKTNMLKVRITIFSKLGIIMRTFLIMIRKIKIKIKFYQYEEVSTAEILRITVMIRSDNKRKSIETINSEYVYLLEFY